MGPFSYENILYLHLFAPAQFFKLFVAAGDTRSDSTFGNETVFPSEYLDMVD